MGSVISKRRKKNNTSITKEATDDIYCEIPDAGDAAYAQVDNESISTGSDSALGSEHGSRGSTLHSMPSGQSLRRELLVRHDGTCATCHRHAHDTRSTKSSNMSSAYYLEMAFNNKMAAGYTDSDYGYRHHGTCPVDDTDSPYDMLPSTVRQTIPTEMDIEIEMPHMIETFQPILEPILVVSELLPYLTLECIRVCDFPQNGSNADAVRRLFKKIIASDESGKWQMFLTALEKAEYSYIKDLLLGKTEADHTETMKMMKLFKKPIMDRICDELDDFIDNLYSRQVINDSVKDQVQQERHNRGSMAGACMLLDRIQGRTENWYQEFLVVLKQRRMDDLVDVLEIRNKKPKKIRKLFGKYKPRPYFPPKIVSSTSETDNYIHPTYSSSNDQTVSKPPPLPQRNRPKTTPELDHLPERHTAKETPNITDEDVVDASENPELHMLREQKKKLDTDLLIKMEKKRLLQEIQETQRQINDIESDDWASNMDNDQSGLSTADTPVRADRATSPIYPEDLDVTIDNESENLTTTPVPEKNEHSNGSLKKEHDYYDRNNHDNQEEVVDYEITNQGVGLVGGSQPPLQCSTFRAASDLEQETDDVQYEDMDSDSESVNTRHVNDDDDDYETLPEEPDTVGGRVSGHRRGAMQEKTLVDLMQKMNEKQTERIEEMLIHREAIITDKFKAIVEELNEVPKVVAESLDMSNYIKVEPSNQTKLIYDIGPARHFMQDSLMRKQGRSALYSVDSGLPEVYAPMSDVYSLY